MVETISSLSTILYAITFLFIINEAKKKDLESVKSAMKNPLWPRTKLSTLLDFYRNYYTSKGLNLLLILNLFCFCVTIIGLIIIISDYQWKESRAIFLIIVIPAIGAILK